MKKRPFLLAAVLAVVLIPVALFAQTVSESLFRIQTDIPTGRVQGFFKRSVTVNGETFEQPMAEVSWEIGADKSVTVGGKTYTYAEVLGAVLAIANQERAEQQAAK
jgi:hypothetical protein